MTPRDPQAKTEQSREPDTSTAREGLAGLAGLWDDGDELADEVGRVVAERRTSRRRSIRDPGRLG